MKKIITTIAVFASLAIYSQVRIGESSATGMSSTSVLLEFGDTKDKGIILPYVETVPTGANDAKGGTLIFDVSANSQYKVRVKNENAGWTDLSNVSGYSAAIETKVKSIQTAALADVTVPNAKAIIGSSTSTTEGVLVLESANKAMVLPIVEDYTKILNPSPGTMAFVKHPTDATKHRLIVFNGLTWSFWKPV